MVLWSHSSELLYGDRRHEPLILLFHTIPLGELAVGGFFVLSGFLNAASWERDPHILSFLRKRIFRIYPGYLVAFFLSACVVGAIGAVDPIGFWHGLSAPKLLIEAITLQIPSTPATFVRWPFMAVNGSMWTIQFEFACYILILGLGVSGLLLRRRVPLLLWTAAILGAFVFRLAGFDDPVTGPVEGSPLIGMRYFHLNYMIHFLPIFLAGAALQRSRIYRYTPPSWMVVVATIVFVAALSERITVDLGIASVGAYLLIWLAHRNLHLDAFRRIPDVSYGVFLYGWPTQKLIIASELTRNPELIFAMSLGLSLLAGYASWYLIEKRALAVGRLLGQQRETSARPLAADAAGSSS